MDKEFPKDKAKSDNERMDSYPVINFCPSYFAMRTFAQAVNENKAKEITVKYNLEYYNSNIGTASPSLKTSWLTRQKPWFFTS